MCKMWIKWSHCLSSLYKSSFLPLSSLFFVNYLIISDFLPKNVWLNRIFYIFLSRNFFR